MEAGQFFLCTRGRVGEAIQHFFSILAAMMVAVKNDYTQLTLSDPHRL